MAPANDDFLEFPEFSDTPKENNGNKDGKEPTSPQRVVHEERRVETASKDEIDNQLKSMTRRTTIEELAKRGKTKNIKTLSERNLKQWIHEALRRVISSSTTIDSAEADRLLANTRSELTAIMEERQAEANNRAADAKKLAELTAQQQAMGRRIAELEQQLLESEAENYRLLEQVQDLDADLASKEYSSSNDAINALRNELSAVKDKHAIAQHEQAQLRKNLGRQLVASTEVVTALLTIDQRFYNGQHQPKNDHSDGSGADGETESEESDAFFADQNAAAAVASDLREHLETIHQRLEELVPAISEGEEGAVAADIERLDHLMWIQEHEEAIAQLQGQLAEAQAVTSDAADPALQSEIDRLRAELDDAEITAEAYEARVGELSAQEAALEEELAQLRQKVNAQPVDSNALAEAQAKAQGLRDELDRLRNEYDQGKKDNIILQGTLSSLRRQLKRAQDQLDQQQQAAIPDHSAELDQARKELADAKGLLEAAQQLSEERGKDLATAKQQLQNSEQTLALQQQQAAEQQALIADLEQQLAAAKQALPDSNLEQELAAARQLAANHQRAIEGLEEQVQKDQQTVDDLRRQVAELNDALQAAKQSAATAKSNNDDGKHREADQQRIAQLEDRCQKLSKQLATAEQKAAQYAAEAESSGSAETKPATDEKAQEEMQRLNKALSRARAMVTASEGAPYEDVSGTLAPRKPGMWLCAWRDPKGRLKTGRTTGDRWVTAGKPKDLAVPEGLYGEPSLMARGDEAMVVWRDIDGMAHVAALDKSARLTADPQRLGPALGCPALSRGGGEAPVFMATTDPSGHVHLHNHDGTAAIDMHRLIHDLPLAVGPATAWHWGLEGSRHIAFRDGDGAIHELLELQGIWYHAPLSAKTGAPMAVSDPQGYAPADHEHVIYLGTDGHIHELCFDGHNWLHHDLNEAAVEAPAASGSPHGAYIAGRHHVLYRGVDGSAHLLRMRRDWRYHSLKSLGQIEGHISLSSCGNEGAVIFEQAQHGRRWARFGEHVDQLVVEDMP